MNSTGTPRGGFIPKPNPEFESQENRKCKIMKWGLSFLVTGFVLQGIGAWWLQ